MLPSYRIPDLVRKTECKLGPKNTMRHSVLHHGSYPLYDPLHLGEPSRRGNLQNHRKLFDQTLLRSSMEAYFDMGGCEYLESRIDATEYGELLPTVDDAVCGLISILDAMNTGDNDRFHLETLHHSKQEIRRILERGGKIDRTVEYAVDDEEEEYEQYHGFSMRM